MGTMRILDETGDTVLTWTPEDDDAVAAAAEAFDHQRRKRRLAFATKPGQAPDQAVALAAFDPTAETIYWVRPLVGG